jgi:hypothetical protein
LCFIAISNVENPGNNLREFVRSELCCAPEDQTILAINRSNRRTGCPKAPLLSQ